MNAIIYTTCAIPLVIWFIILIGDFTEWIRKNRRRNILTKYNQSLIEEERKKAKLKIPGYYEDFFAPEDKSKYHSLNYFSNYWL